MTAQSFGKDHILIFENGVVSPAPEDYVSPLAAAKRA